MHLPLIDDDGDEEFLRMPFATHPLRRYAKLHDKLGDADPAGPVGMQRDVVALDVQADAARRRAPDPRQLEERVGRAAPEGARVLRRAAQAVEVVAHLVERNLAVARGDLRAVDGEAGASPGALAVQGRRGGLICGKGRGGDEGEEKESEKSGHDHGDGWGGLGGPVLGA